ncbi:MarR family winged helix-turn-helix transcriptional regulator [Kitasatospora sp. NPDC059463]|uniref:MarR family winged helix-turn-helix transcriptional regulator n=1 Tax=unclassified Kitasatospora TaxID=2633591 RepID=UPI0036814F48
MSGPSEPGGPTDEVAFEYMVLSRHHYLSSAGVRPHGSGLDRSAYILLSRIRVQGPMSIGELSDAFGLDASTLNRQTAAMTRAGLVERIPDPQGGLARKFRITEEGDRRLDEDRAAHAHALGLVMADWASEDIEAFAAFLRRFNTGIERLDGRPWPRP